MPPVRLAALLAAFSLAGDLGHGRTLEHSLRTAYLGGRLAAKLGLSAAQRRAVLYVGLLQAVGCVGNAHDISADGWTDDIAFKRDIAPAIFLARSDQLRVVARHFGSDRPAIARPLAIARAIADPDARRRNQLAHCETGALIARRAGLGDDVAGALFGTMERWDGRGLPAGLREEEIPLVSRVVTAALAAELFRAVDAEAIPLERLRTLAGNALDPSLAGALGTLAPDAWSALDAPTLWDDVLALEPPPHLTVEASDLDAVSAAFADFADVKSPWFVGHSRGVARLAADAGRLLHLAPTEVDELRRSALLHDVGRASVPNTVLEKPRALTPGERERVRLHVYYTERVLERAPGLETCARIAAGHHERLDGSGYHRGARGPALALASRVLSAADAFHALTEPRAYRAARGVERAASLTRAEAAAGRLDSDAVEAVIAAAAVPSARQVRATTLLSERELDVVRLLAAAHGNKEIARRLDISDNTVRHHLESVYAKLDVSTRTGAVMRALERGLL